LHFYFFYNLSLDGSPIEDVGVLESNYVEPE
jgi:hypothetical protein